MNLMRYMYNTIRISHPVKTRVPSLLRITWESFLTVAWAMSWFIAKSNIRRFHVDLRLGQVNPHVTHHATHHATLVLCVVDAGHALGLNMSLDGYGSMVDPVQ